MKRCEPFFISDGVAIGWGTRGKVAQPAGGSGGETSDDAGWWRRRRVVQTCAVQVSSIKCKQVWTRV